MNVDLQDRARLLRRLAWSGAGLAFGLIVLGGWVRITGSGMGCGDHWPTCNGHWLPPLDDPKTLIEFGHRWIAFWVSLLVVAATGVAWVRHRAEPRLLVPATLGTVLLVAQVLLGAVTVKLELPPWVVIVHFANALVLLAVLMVTALRAGNARAGAMTSIAPTGETGRRHGAHGLVLAAAVLGFVVVLFGAKVANFNAGLVCRGFPLCNGSLLPPPTPFGTVHWLHRVLAFGFLATIVAVVWRVRTTGDRALVRAASAVLVLTLLQIGVAAAMMLQLLPSGLRALHLLVGTAVWGSLVVLVYVSGRTGVGAVLRGRPLDGGDAVRGGDDEHRPYGDPAVARPSMLRDFVTLTKPRIISLLLVTTVAPMFITDHGLPSVALVFWVVIGGYLMAGGANAINMWFDRDIDTIMARTRARPIPSGRISAGVGLAFGLTLGAVAFAIFWYLVNPLSAWLALGGLLFYVLIYTVWLKRWSTQNIVVGGAAGAFPPLVGWAAVTGSIDLAAIYLFAIIFYWTPPHFWALALVKQGEYARAGVPMMPVVRGNRRTKVEMLIYTLLLLPLTILPSFFGALGPFYGVAAALLGARLLWYCVQLLREPTVTPTAWRMYKYSLLYLALLFVAMGVDRALPFGPERQPDVLILDTPGQSIAMPMVEQPVAGTPATAQPRDQPMAEHRGH